MKLACSLVLLAGAAFGAPDAGARADAATDAAPASPAPKLDLDRADADFAAGRYAAAQAVYARAAEAQPDAFGIRYRLALASAAAGDTAAAERHAAHAARLDPGNPEAQALAAALAAPRWARPADAGLADAERALRQGRLRAAERLAAKALDGDPSPADAARLHTVRGRALAALGQSAAGLRAFKAAAAYGQVDPRIWLMLADAARAAGDRQRAATLSARATSPLKTPAASPASEEAQ